jgi:hypothetical protein
MNLLVLQPSIFFDLLYILIFWYKKKKASSDSAYNGAMHVVQFAAVRLQWDFSLLPSKFRVVLLFIFSFNCGPPLLIGLYLFWIFFWIFFLSILSLFIWFCLIFYIKYGIHSFDCCFSILFLICFFFFNFIPQFYFIYLFYPIFIVILLIALFFFYHFLIFF